MGIFMEVSNLDSKHSVSTRPINYTPEKKK